MVIVNMTDIKYSTTPIEQYTFGISIQHNHDKPVHIWAVSIVLYDRMISKVYRINARMPEFTLEQLCLKNGDTLSFEITDPLPAESGAYFMSDACSYEICVECVDDEKQYATIIKNKKQGERAKDSSFFSMLFDRGAERS